MKQAYMPTEGQNPLEWAPSKRDTEFVMTLRPSAMLDAVIDPTYLPLPRKKAIGNPTVAAPHTRGEVHPGHTRQKPR